MRKLELTHSQIEIILTALDNHSLRILDVAKQVALIKHNNIDIRDDYTRVCKLIDLIQSGELDK